MTKESFFGLLMLAIIGVSFYFFYLVFSPYLVPLGWATILALVFYPAYRKFDRSLGGHSTLASIITTALTILIIVLPAVLLVFLLGKEIVQIYRFFEEGVKTDRFQLFVRWREIPWVAKVIESLNPWVDLSQVDLQNIVLVTLKKVSTWVLDQSKRFIVGFSQFVFGFLLMTLSMFYFFRDGKRLMERIKALIPLAPEEKDLLLSRIDEMVHATVFGGVLVAIIQGFLGGLAFWILGLPSPILWGCVMAILAFVPVVGPFLVWLPAAGLLVLYGQDYVKAFILVVWGIVVVGLSDNLLRPILISGRTKLNTLILFFAVLGGLKAFGFLGLVLGPLVVTICLAILDIYSSKLEREDQRALGQIPSQQQMAVPSSTPLFGNEKDTRGSRDGDEDASKDRPDPNLG